MASTVPADRVDMVAWVKCRGGPGEGKTLECVRRTRKTKSPDPVAHVLGGVGWLEIRTEKGVRDARAARLTRAACTYVHAHQL